MSTETALSYAALILADSDLEISSESLLKLTEGANVTVDKIWADLFAKALDGKDLASYFFTVASGSAPAAAGAAASASGAATEEAAEEEKEEEKEESDDEMGFGLFD
ncbi:unnamed protein product [[Candida] boidinii]|uniref:Unnamed protein product n=1 Tax=Candida boidinii TaxID=5477 RepID=A0A9W6SVK9_CANBO|nr:hypothetical protein BVG19_g3674 [[Candida] boidinii]OWB51749.1 hypothetical protein B5S27_g3315 [[Candida] boidinii]OWB68571.1 hypothetical protein B5S30_g3954 [[Candida] boidinii]OWB85175.1 hypothetical protein B5S33_g3834 [[Candida] boidinii]GME67259.1 unnamed protein product [[Candida] boidinii]